MMTAEEVSQLIHYDPQTGEFLWAEDRFKGPHRKALCARRGQPAGSYNAKGYRQISVGGRNHGAHRLAWLLMTGEWPEHQIDHIDRDPSNNRWTNLRAATSSQNMANQGVRKDNKLGVRGVYPRDGIFVAQIGANGRQLHLGHFRTLDGAIAARRAAETRLHGEYAGAQS